LHAQKIFAILSAGGQHSELVLPGDVIKCTMPRRKANPEELLSHNIIVRVTEALFNRLEDLRKKSKELSIAEVCRRILENRKVKIYTEDTSMNPVMEELALIRKELRAIGVNINQVTKAFNTDKAGHHRPVLAFKVAELYKKVGDRVEVLLGMVSKLAEKWLQE
jgi:hypothetical protein